MHASEVFTASPASRSQLVSHSQHSLSRREFASSRLLLVHRLCCDETAHYIQNADLILLSSFHENGQEIHPVSVQSVGINGVDQREKKI